MTVNFSTYMQVGWKISWSDTAVCYYVTVFCSCIAGKLGTYSHIDKK